MSVANAIGRMLPETITQQRRIIADGGTVVNPTWMNNVIRTMKAMGIYGNAKLLTDANFGVKKDGSGAVSKLYDISGNNNDAVQATGTSQPIWSLVNGRGVITYDGVDDYLLTTNTLNYLTTDNFTWNAKIKTAIDSRMIMGRIDNAPPNDPSIFMAVGIASSALDDYKFRVYIRDNAGINTADPGIYSLRTIADNNLHNLYFVKGNLITINTDNIDIVNATNNINAVTLRLPISIGALYNRLAFTFNFSGQINSSTIFNIALTQSQITTLYNLGL